MSIVAGKSASAATASRIASETAPVPASAA
jgi:hypothetical protein